MLPPGSLRLDGDRLFGTVHGVPWGHRAQHLIALVDGVVVLAPDRSPAGRPAIAGSTSPTSPVTPCGSTGGGDRRADAPVTEQALRERTALGRAELIGGALSAVAAMTLRYTSEREQFGRPIGRFQAVQAHLVTIHQQATVVAAAVDAAVAAVEAGTAGFEIACAKMLADRGAQLAARAAHQAHGAIGMTKEYPLHLLTRRLWAWRTEGGGHQRWADLLGQTLVAAGPDALYPAIQSGSAVVTAVPR